MKRHCRTTDRKEHQLERGHIPRSMPDVARYRGANVQGILAALQEVMG